MHFTAPTGKMCPLTAQFAFAIKILYKKKQQLWNHTQYNARNEHHGTKLKRARMRKDARDVRFDQTAVTFCFWNSGKNNNLK